ncbi:MAG TPA: peptide ABC transporter substrate-binding protein [Candidatus Tumulicola sp.]|nr:peptide ABC transporter substrate-binding protein [Candidatus Tumulicola sp.]
MERTGKEPFSPSLLSKAGCLRTPLTLLATALLLAACSKVGGSGWGTAHELRIGLVNDPPSLNPLFEYVERQIDLTQLYCETLVGLDAHNRLVPLLATQVPSAANGGISRDGRTIVYHLRHDARFADGVPLTSKDVAFTYRAILDPRNPVVDADPYRIIAGLDTPDKYTVRIRLRHPWAAAVGELFAPSDFAFGILPAHAFASTDIAHAAWNSRPFGSGPFRVERWARGDEIDLVPNPYAWRKPHLHRLIFKIVADNEAMFDAFRAHDLDVDNLTILQVPQARALGDVTLLPVARNGFDYLSFQTAKAPTNDVRVRRAIVQAIDRADLLRQTYVGLRPIADTEIPNVLWAHDPAIRPPRYDPVAAGRALDAAGWRLSGTRRMRNGVPLTIELVSDPRDYNRRIDSIVQRDLSLVGIDVTIRTFTNPLMYAPAAAGGIQYGGRFNLFADNLYGGTDPEESEQWTCVRRAPNGPNMARFCDAAYDAAYANQQLTLDRAARGRFFGIMQQRIAAQAVLLPLVNDVEYVAINPALRDFRPNMLYDYGDGDRWDVVRP